MVAAPRVGMVPYAEHLSEEMKVAHVHRVANEADVVTMLPTYPFVHSPYVHGTYLLEGGMLKITPCSTCWPTATAACSVGVAQTDQQSHSRHA